MASPTAPTQAPATTPSRESLTPQADNGDEDAREGEWENKAVPASAEPSVFPLKFCTVCASNQNRYVHF